jgi:hypothetical protein
LRQIPERTAAHYFASCRIILSAEDTEHGSFSGAITANDANFVASHHSERGTLHHILSADFDGDILNLQHV